jgi:hypothetical protein
MISYFYANTLENITTALCEKFSHMEVHRFNKDRTQLIKIINPPLMFTPLEKVYMSRTEDYTVEPESQGIRYYQTLPRLALQFDGAAYAPDRVTGANEQREFLSKDGQTRVDFMPTPWNFTYTLSFKAEYISDWSQIVESILPYFNPKLYLRVKEFSWLNLERDIPITLNSFTPSFSDELDKTQKRSLDSQINFTAEGYLYKPVTDAVLVEEFIARFYCGDQSINQLDNEESVTSAGIAKI